MVRTCKLIDSATDNMKAGGASSWEINTQAHLWERLYQNKRIARGDCWRTYESRDTGIRPRRAVSARRAEDILLVLRKQACACLLSQHDRRARGLGSGGDGEGRVGGSVDGGGRS